MLSLAVFVVSVSFGSFLGSGSLSVSSSSVLASKELGLKESESRSEWFFVTSESELARFVNLFFFLLDFDSHFRIVMQVS